MKECEWCGREVAEDDLHVLGYDLICTRCYDDAWYDSDYPEDEYKDKGSSEDIY